MLGLVSREVRFFVANSVTQLSPEVAGHVLVAGSHGGLIAGVLVARANVRAVILNDAGVGFDRAGIASLYVLQQHGMAAAAVARASAQIGDGQQMLARGFISHANELAQHLGVRAGMACRAAAELLTHAPQPAPFEIDYQLGRHVTESADVRVVACDSICLVQPQDAGAILVIGSHSALHAGPPSALPVPAAAAFFHDAGSSGESAGISRLPILELRGIPAATVHYNSARIGDARSMIESGEISFLNAPACAAGLYQGMRVRDAIALLKESLRSDVSPANPLKRLAA